MSRHNPQQCRLATEPKEDERGLTRTKFCASLPCLPLEIPYNIIKEELTIPQIKQQGKNVKKSHTI